MPVLGPTDPLPPGLARILVVGTAGSGKTTLAGRIGERLGIPHVELDNLYWGPGWSVREAFRSDVEAMVATDAWVTEWQYHTVRPLTAGRAQVMVWLDLSVGVRMGRVVRRTLRRRLAREPMWDAGNLEPPLWTIFTQRDHIVRWAWRYRHRFDDLPDVVARQFPHLHLVRLGTPAEVEEWLSRL